PSRPGVKPSSCCFPPFGTPLFDMASPCALNPDLTIVGRGAFRHDPENDSDAFDDTLLAGRLARSEEHTSELQSRFDLVCRLLLEKKNLYINTNTSHFNITCSYL